MRDGRPSGARRGAFDSGSTRCATARPRAAGTRPAVGSWSPLSLSNSFLPRTWQSHPSRATQMSKQFQKFSDEARTSVAIMSGGEVVLHSSTSARRQQRPDIHRTLLDEGRYLQPTRTMHRMPAMYGRYRCRCRCRCRCRDRRNRPARVAQTTAPNAESMSPATTESFPRLQRLRACA